MIFGRMSKEGKEFVLVGLSKENIRQMNEGTPITIGPVPNDPAMGNMTVILITGETEADIAETLQKSGIST